MIKHSAILPLLISKHKFFTLSELGVRVGVMALEHNNKA